MMVTNLWLAVLIVLPSRKGESWVSVNCVSCPAARGAAVIHFSMPRNGGLEESLNHWN